MFDEQEPEQVVEEHMYQPFGGALELFHARDPEILIEGPAGTGKTRAILELVNFYCENFDNIRVLLTRATRKSMTESVLVTFEEKVLWKKHPAVTGRAKRDNRTSYTYPNGSHIVVAGLDNPGRTFSTEYDIVVVFEAWETTLDTWEKLFRANRNNVMPFQLMIADTNPAHETHWLNQRAKTPKMRRILSRHTDNPSVTPDYLSKLQSLSGHRRDRLYLGRWVSAEGMVYPNWDPSVHLISREQVPEIKYYIGAVDWGFKAPGCFQVWGVDEHKRIYRMAEVYRTQQQLDWWAEVAMGFFKEFQPMRAIVCDPAEPRSIEYFNDRLGHMTGRDMARIAQKADNRMKGKSGERVGFDLVRWGLDKDKGGTPRIQVVRDVFPYGKDQELVDGSKTTCLEEEILGFIFAESEDGKPTRDEPDRGCDDHALDPMRYVCNFLWKRDLTEPEDEFPDFEEGTFGDLLGHKEILMGSR